MSQYEHRRAGLNRYSRDGFQPLTGNESNGRDATINIPMQQVPATDPGFTKNLNSGYSTGRASPSANEKFGVHDRMNNAGHRKSLKPKSSTNTGGAYHRYGHGGTDDDEHKVTSMGAFYKKVLSFSIVTRYLVYILPLATLLAIPIIVGATAEQNASIGGIKIVWFFVWLECAWVGLWISKAFAQFLPYIYRFLCGIVSSGTRKYSIVIVALEIPLSMAGWALVSLATFKPIMTENPDTHRYNIEHPKAAAPHWVDVVSQILAAALVAALCFLVEKVLIQLLSINYHRRQFHARIKESKHNIFLLSLLYDASRAMFPSFCHEFSDEDEAIADTIDIKLGHKIAARRGIPHHRSGSTTPMKLIRNVGRFGDKLTSAFGDVAHEVTGKDVFNPDSAHSIVVEALEKNRSSEALARRLWLSFVIEGQDALYHEDIVEVLGAGRHAEADECFAVLDRDANGDVSLDEMIITVTELGRERKSMANSMHDVDQAINVLDSLLCVVVFIVIIFVFVAFLNASFVTTLATTGTALISLSFVFAVTAQEVLGSCIFLFIKHPFDIGDRVTITKEDLIVEHISLLYTVFRKIQNHQMVQIPNILLNTVWIENVSRSKAMREQLSIYVDFATSFEDVQILKNEMAKFVAEKDNSRDFFPDVDIQLLGIGTMNKLELRVDILHKSNWANETVRAARRSKFMCALVLALRKVPINPPGGAAASIGDPTNPSYSVAISDDTAAKNKLEAAAKTEAARLVPTKATEPKTSDKLAANSETKAMDLLNERSPALDGARDDEDVSGFREADRAGGQTQDLEEVRGVLRRQTTKGRRKSARSQPDDSSTVDSPNPQLPQIGITSPLMTQGSSQGRHIPEKSEGSITALPQPPPRPPPKHVGPSSSPAAPSSWRP